MIVGKEVYSLSRLPKRIRRSVISSASLLALLVVAASLGAFGGLHVNPALASNTVNVWWPTDGAHVSGLQPFKAMVEGTPVEQYDMYWQVDGGALVPMTNSYTDYPHKEAAVNVSGWNWHGSGPYVIHFVAKQNGNVIGESTENLYINNGAPAQAQAQPVVVMGANQLLQMPAPTSVQPAPAPSTSPQQGSVQVWWPTNGATLSGIQPFKAVVSGMSTNDYDMYWQVDNGGLVLMQDTATDGSHKEASVNLSGWAWHGAGPYYVNFIAKDKSGKTIGQEQVQVMIGNQSGVQAAPQTSSAPSPTFAVSLSQPLVSVSSNDPLSGSRLYVNPNSSASQQAKSWQSSRPQDAQAMQTLANQPTAVWLGSWDSNIYSDVQSLVSAAANQSSVPVMVAYNIPGRDCSGGYSSGGASSADQYRSWISSIASAIGDRKAVVVLEPDALADLSCLSQGDQQTRLSLISQAVSTLKQHANTVVYIDAGHSGWIAPSTMAASLRQAGVGQADGFALNVSNFDSTNANEGYGEQISQLLGGKHYVIDTSRNGNGSNGEWCNPSGRAIGTKPTAATGNAQVDAFLWLKTPGESDGACNGGPNAGQWWADYALGLVHNAGQ